MVCSIVSSRLRCALQVHSALVMLKLELYSLRISVEYASMHMFIVFQCRKGEHGPGTSLALNSSLLKTARTATNIGDCPRFAVVLVSHVGVI